VARRPTPPGTPETTGVGHVVDLVRASIPPLHPAGLPFVAVPLAVAVAAGKRKWVLETGDQQIAFLDGMDRAEQVQMLDEALDDAAPGNDEIQVLHALWRAGEADAIWKRLGGRMQREYPGLYRRINVERNTAWLAELRRRLDAPGGDDTLVVVGSLHLLGPDGLVARLRDAGYRVRRICTACAPGVAREGRSTNSQPAGAMISTVSGPREAQPCAPTRS